MDKKIKHLEFIQGVINRMAGNLFFLRGWTITLIAGLFVFFAKENNKNAVYIVYFPVIIFWILDGYFLSQERLFRELYDDVRKKSEKQIDFSMNTKKFLKKKNNHWLNSMFSGTLLFFYIPLILIMSVIIYYIQ